MKHYSKDDLLKFHYEGYDNDTTNVIQKHLVLCEKCSGLYKEVVEFQEMLNSLEEKNPLKNSFDNILDKIETEAKLKKHHIPKRFLWPNLVFGMVLFTMAVAVYFLGQWHESFLKFDILYESIGLGFIQGFTRVILLLMASGLLITLMMVKLLKLESQNEKNYESAN